ncbi:MAG: hypothetical protein WDN24_07485 [Sphingomonas sp.]
MPPGAQWAHLDIFCWNGSPKPGRPKGGEAAGLRAVWKMPQGPLRGMSRTPSGLDTTRFAGFDRGP